VTGVGRPEPPLVAFAAGRAGPLLLPPMLPEGNGDDGGEFESGSICDDRSGWLCDILKEEREEGGETVRRGRR
jgi:hypothetical protein